MDLTIPEEWYNCLNKILFIEWNKNNPNCPCVFTNKSLKGFIIVAVYVDSLIKTPEEFKMTANYLKKDFERKYLGK